MKYRKSAVSFLGGVLCTLLTLTLVSPAFAASVQKTISVSLGGISVFVDDVKINPTNANGKPVDIINYGGTTYLPVRAISQALGKNVTWDGTTGSVFVGDHAPDNKPAVPLYDLDYFSSTSNGKITHERYKDNLGVMHETTETSHINLTKSRDVVYKINGKYSAFTGKFFLPFEERGRTTTYTLDIYGDDAMLWNGTVTDGVEPLDINIDLKGVQTLTFKYSTSSIYGASYLIGDSMFFT